MTICTHEQAPRAAETSFQAQSARALSKEVSVTLFGVVLKPGLERPSVDSESQGMQCAMSMLEKATTSQNKGDRERR